MSEWIFGGYHHLLLYLQTSKFKTTLLFLVKRVPGRGLEQRKSYKTALYALIIIIIRLYSNIIIYYYYLIKMRTISAETGNGTANNFVLNWCQFRVRAEILLSNWDIFGLFIFISVVEAKIFWSRDEETKKKQHNCHKKFRLMSLFCFLS